jgi:hypothetical protein
MRLRDGGHNLLGGRPTLAQRQDHAASGRADRSRELARIKSPAEAGRGPAPQASHKAQTCSYCSVRLGDWLEGEGARGGPRAALRAPLVFARRATPHLSSLAGIAKMPKDKGAAQSKATRSSGTTTLRSKPGGVKMGLSLACGWWPILAMFEGALEKPRRSLPGAFSCSPTWPI